VIDKLIRDDIAKWGKVVKATGSGYALRRQCDILYFLI